MNADHALFDTLLDRFLVDELSGTDLDRFFDLLDDPAEPDRRDHLGELLELQEILEARRSAVVPARTGRRRPWPYFAAFAALAAGALLFVRSVQDSGAPGVTGGLWTGKGLSDGGTPVGLSVHLLLRDPLTGVETRADLANPVSEHLSALPTLRCDRPCSVVVYLLGADGRAIPQNTAPLSLTGGIVRGSDWVSLAGRGDAATWVGVAWSSTGEAPGDPLAVAEGRATNADRAEARLSIRGRPK